VRNLRLALVIGVLVALALCSGAAMANSGGIPAFQPPMPSSYVDNGATTAPLWDTYEANAGQTALLTGSAVPGGSQDVYAGQPLIAYRDWTGFGECIDWGHNIGISSPPVGGNPGYGAYYWEAALGAGKIGEIVGGTATWDALTTMWHSAVVTTDYDRAALQVATWAVAANQTGFSGPNLTISADGALLSEAANYMALANNPTGLYAHDYVILSGSAQAFAAAVPEPGTVVAALSVLAPVAFVFRRRRV
jgi:hypothetical protein